jgi:hypothetical protein
MNKLLIAGIISVLAAAMIWFAFFQNKANDQPGILDNPANGKSAGKNNSTGGNGSEEIGENSFTGTIKDLLSRQTAMKCTAEYILEAGKQSQTIYSDGKNTRLETKAVINGNESKAYVVIKDGWEYIWNDIKIEGAPVPNSGMKIKFSELDKNNASSGADPSEQAGLNMEKPMDFSCQPWTVSASMFELPSNIEFVDYTAQTNDLINNAPADACDACRMMPTSEMREMCEEQNCRVDTPEP